MDARGVSLSCLRSRAEGAGVVWDAGQSTRTPPSNTQTRALPVKPPAGPAPFTPLRGASGGWHVRRVAAREIQVVVAEESRARADAGRRGARRREQASPPSIRPSHQ